METIIEGGTIIGILPSLSHKNDILLAALDLLAAAPAKDPVGFRHGNATR